MRYGTGQVALFHRYADHNDFVQHIAVLFKNDGQFTVGGYLRFGRPVAYVRNLEYVSDLGLQREVAVDIRSRSFPFSFYKN